ncbi:MAG: hypothetical protein ABSF10_20475, partial [Verrucomicrobiota bacterium]
FWTAKGRSWLRSPYGLPSPGPAPLPCSVIETYFEVTNSETAGKQADSAIFHSDYAEPLIPVFSRSEVVGSTFHVLVVDLLLQLYHSILSPEDLAVKYGLNNHRISVPNDKTTYLPPGEPPTTFDPEDPERRL